jgi:branched-chain amino acid transport system substrate-binding protein
MQLVRRFGPLALVAAVALLLAACQAEEEQPAAGTPAAQQPTKEPIVIGMMYDGTGATQLIGVAYKAGFEDYINLINSKGGVEGHPIRVEFCEHGYTEPKGVECYEAQKRAGAIGTVTYGTPITNAVIGRCNSDGIVCTFPGYGAAAAANGDRFPFGFPIAASYWSQAGAAVRFVLDEWQREGRPGKPKIAFLYYDNPAGREPLEVLRSIAQREGLQIDEVACPAPCPQMSAEVTRIVQSIRADWVITHLFGTAPSVSIKTFKEAGFPLNRVISFVWGSGDADVEAAGGWAFADGYYGLQFTAIGTDLPVVQEIQQMYRSQGKQPPEVMTKNNVYYLRGVGNAAVFVEGIRNALRQKGYPITGADLKAGLEAIRGEVAGIVNLSMSNRDHEGGGRVRVYQVRGGRWQLARDWFQGYRDVVESFVYR